MTADTDTTVRGAPVRRVAIPKGMRFEVFKRDCFTCQYCGKKAPDVVLHCDHIKAVADSGTTDLLNLITACMACNLGKSDVPLDDSTTINKQRAQLEELQERREQIEMMMDWKTELLALQHDTVTQAAEFWASLVPGFSLNERGQQSLKKWLRKYPLDNVLEAMQRSVEQYIIGAATSEDVETAWKYVARICNVMAADEKKPYLKDILYIRGILRNRLSWCDEQIALDRLEDAHIRGVAIEQLTRLAKRSTSWKAWSAALDDLVEARPAPPPINHRIHETAAFAPLVKELERFDEYALERVLGYAKGVAMSAEVFNDSPEDQQPPDRSVSLESDGEAFGFGDALGLIRSSDRSDNLRVLGPIDHGLVFELETGCLEQLPTEIGLLRAARGQPAAQAVNEG
jgi:hypothetical protein